MSAREHCCISPISHAYHTLCTFFIWVVMPLHTEEFMQNEVAALDEQQLLQKFGLPNACFLAEAEVTDMGLRAFAVLRDDFDDDRDQCCVLKGQ